MDFSELSVMVLDDELPSRQLISTLIEKEFKAKVSNVANPKDAFEIMKTDKPDLLILDLQMPVMDGYTALVHIRTTDYLKDLSVIPCTALSSKELILNLYKLNITDYILKPINRKTLIEKVGNALQAVQIKKNLDAAKKNIQKKK
jgi:CheY-like chemotaxis protein